MPQILLIDALRYPSFRVTRTVNKSQFQSDEVIFESEVSRVTKNLITRMKKTRSTKSENDVTHVLHLKLHERMNKKQIRSN